MSIGGATGDGTLPHVDKAREFAQTLFHLFLGGDQYQEIRPFGRYDLAQTSKTLILIPNNSDNENAII